MRGSMRVFGIDMTNHYYRVKPLIPRRLQLAVRSAVATRQRAGCGDCWPIESRAGVHPEGWRGWPDGKRFALVLTHDVDTYRGHERCLLLSRLEEELGFRSSFNFVAEDYLVSANLRWLLAERGFEVGVHGLVHSRELYASRENFRRHAVRINDYLRSWDAVGFRSPCMYHNLDWLQDLNISYDASTFDTDPFEPQPDGVGTILPFRVEGTHGRKGFVELPYTLPQDFTLFILLREQSIDIWKQKLDWIVACGGMALVNTHPDYMAFDREAVGREEYPVTRYLELLRYLETRYRGEYWQPLPKEIAAFVNESRLRDAGREDA